MAQDFSTVTLTGIAKKAYNQMQWIVEFQDEEVKTALDVCLRYPRGLSKDC
jgi:hypothetical protein